jgi:hypothetical protein
LIVSYDFGSEDLPKYLKLKLKSKLNSLRLKGLDNLATICL